MAATSNNTEPGKVLASADDDATSFLDLPTEVRNMIYVARLQLASKNPRRHGYTIKEFLLRYAIVRSLFLANKQILSEALPVFFGNNVLTLKTEMRGTYQTNNGNNGGREFVDWPWKLDSNGTPDQLSDRFRVELPPSRLRHLFKLVSMVVLAPTDWQYQHFHRLEMTAKDKFWKTDNVDWLYLLRNLRALGFSRLERLTINVVHWGYKNTAATDAFKVWTEERLRGMTNAREMVINFHNGWDTI